MLWLISYYLHILNRDELRKFVLPEIVKLNIDNLNFPSLGLLVYYHQDVVIAQRKHNLSCFTV